MENATEALKMAGSVLLFVIALSIAMLTFSQARETINILLQHADRSGFTDEHIGTGDRVENAFYYIDDRADPDEITERYVGLETIIPTAYRAAIESFRIDFIFPEGEDVYLYKNYNNFKTGVPWEKICYIDIDTVRNVTGGTGTTGDLANKGNTSGTGVSDSKDFITGILFGQNSFKPGENFYTKSAAMGNHRGRYPYGYDGGYTSLVEYIENFLSNPAHRIVEKIGTYYQQDVAENRPTIEDENKTIRRLVTYEFLK